MTNECEPIPDLSDSSDFEGMSGTIAARAKRRAKVVRISDAKKQRAKDSVVNKICRKGVVTRNSGGDVDERTRLILSSQDEFHEDVDDVSSSDEEEGDNYFGDVFQDALIDDVDGDEVVATHQQTASEIDPYKDDLPRVILRAVVADAETGTEVEKMLRRNDPTVTCLHALPRK